MVARVTQKETGFNGGQANVSGRKKSRSATKPPHLQRGQGRKEALRNQDSVQDMGTHTHSACR